MTYLRLGFCLSSSSARRDSSPSPRSRSPRSIHLSTSLRIGSRVFPLAAYIRAYVSAGMWQVPLDNYRVDFAVGRVVYSLKALDPSSDDEPKDVLLKLPALVIECDGHDFHERTKEQAQRDKSRDRQLQSMGYRVIRFTGSEIYRDPAKCANEVDAIFESLRSPRVREAGSYE